MRVPPPITVDLSAWAQAVNRFLVRLNILDSRDARSTAAEDGALIWDRSGYPVVTRGGAFVQIGTRVAVPATATSDGVPGDYACDGSHAYFCIAADTWVRAPVATW